MLAIGCHSRAAPRGVYLSIATNQSKSSTGTAPHRARGRERKRKKQAEAGLPTLTRISIQSCLAYTTRHRTPSRSQSFKKRTFGFPYSFISAISAISYHLYPIILDLIWDVHQPFLYSTTSRRRNNPGINSCSPGQWAGGDTLTPRTGCRWRLSDCPHTNSTYPTLALTQTGQVGI